MKQVQFTIPGEPVAQGRPRFTTINGYARAYDPVKSKDFKSYIKWIAADKMKGHPPMEGAISISIAVFRNIPKSFSKKRAMLAEKGILRPITKPDLDNYEKGIKDALKGICWRDDSQIVAHHEPFGKYYSTNPRVEVTIAELEEGLSNV